MNGDDVIKQWNKADPKTIHPSRRISENEYWQSGGAQANLLSLDIPKQARVLDFGCGDGRVAIPLSALGYDVTGYDASENMLEAYKKNAQARGVSWSALHDLPLSFNELTGFDAAYCLAVLIHQSYEDAKAILKRIVSSVRPGGILCLDWPISDTPHERTHWIDVTTWSEEAHSEFSYDELGLTIVPVDRPWFVFRKNA